MERKPGIADLLLLASIVWVYFDPPRPPWGMIPITLIAIRWAYLWRPDLDYQRRKKASQSSKAKRDSP